MVRESSHTMMLRWKWDAVWMGVADIIAKRSRCVRSQVGAVIVSKTNQVCATSYNGPPAGLEVGEDDCSHWCPRALGEGGPAYYDDCHASHAEVNGLIMGDRSKYEGGTLYCTRVPCYTCAKIIANSGVSRVVLRVASEDAEREPDRSIAMLQDSGLEVIEWLS